jgi:hypothetical protein
MFIMKKLSILMLGTIIGAALAITTSAYADNITSLIGRTIQGEFPVTIEGKELSKKALVIDGTSYVPLRAFGDAIGYNSTFDAELGITFKVNEAKKMDNQQSVEEAKQEAKAENDIITGKIIEANAANEVKTQAMIALKQKINVADSEVLKYQSRVDKYSKATDDISKSLYYPDTDFESFIKQYTDPLEKVKVDRAELQKQLDNLITPSPSPTPTP